MLTIVWEIVFKKCLGTFHLPPHEILSHVCNLCRKNTKEEVKLFISEYSLKSACIASSDRSNSCASDWWVACGAGGVTTFGMYEWFLLASLELSTPCVSTKGDLRPTVIFNFWHEWSIIHSLLNLTLYLSKWKWCLIQSLEWLSGVFNYKYISRTTFLRKYK